MKIITHEDILNLNIDYSEFYQWIIESFKKKYDMILPVKTSITQPQNRFFNIMPSINIENEVFGLKVVTRIPERTPSLDSQVYLYDAKDGKLKAIMDGNYITAIRTAAVTTLAISMFARKNFNSIGIMGLGVTATSTLKMISEIYNNKEITIRLLKYKGQEIKFNDKFKDIKNLKFEIFDTAEEMIKDSDIVISSITYANDYISDIKWYKEGVLLIPVHVMGFGNIDKLFDKVYMDDFEHLSMIENYKNIINKEELSKVLLGKSKGRENDNEKIISYNIGLSIHDILFADKIYRKYYDADEKELYLNNIKTKNWL